MLDAARRRVGESSRAFRDVVANPDLRRVQVALAVTVTAEWAYGIGLIVYAYLQGGAAEAGVTSIARWIPAAFAAPFVAVLADRFRRERVMIAANGVRVALLALIALVVVLDGPPLVVYALAVVVSVAAKAFRPAQVALLPSLARSPNELTAANVASSAIDSMGSVVGPAVGGLVLALVGPGWVFALAAALLTLAVLLVALVRRPQDEGPARARTRLAAEIGAGFRAIGASRGLQVLVGLYAFQTFAAGALNILVVVAAVELLALGAGGAGYLTAAIGVGGMTGAVLSLALVGRRRLATAFAAGNVLWGTALALVGVWPVAAAALVLLGLLGVGSTIVDVSAVTLLQRTTPDEVLARVFGALEGLLVAALALGAVAAPALVALLGERGALVATGAAIPALALAAWRPLARVDAAAAPSIPERALELLSATPIFEPLPTRQLERLAAQLAPVRVPAGETIFRAGDRGDRFYVVAAGRAAVATGSGARELGPGDFFGEIALLRDVPRTATVTAASDLELYALERDEFLATVNGWAPSARAAEAVIGTRLA